MLQSKPNSGDWIKRFLLIGVSIALFAASMPGHPFPLLTWVVVVPVAFALQGARPAFAAVLFYLAALGCILMVMSWFMAAVINFTHLNGYLAFLVLIVFAALLALPYALIGWLIAYKNWLVSISGIITASACLVVLVIFYPSPLPGTYAHSLYSEASWIQIVDLGGIPLLLFVVVLVNLLLFRLIDDLIKQSKSAARSAVIVTLILAGTYFYGAWRIDSLSMQADNARQYAIGIVQPKLLRKDSLDRLYRMTGELVRDNPELDLVVWPEFPTAFSFSDNQQDQKKLKRLINKIKKPMLVASGYSYEDSDGHINETSEYYNLTHLINEKGQLVGTYKKQILVPFFEYIPLEKQLSFLRKLFPGTYRYIPGDKYTLFQFGALNLIPLICYETVFPDISKNFVGEGGNVIINLTNDIWLGDSLGSNYHFAMGMFRAIEHRVPWVRATNSGISGYVPATGVIDKNSLTPVQSLTTKVYSISVPEQRSFYSRYGDWFLYLATLLVIVAVMQKTKR